MDGVTIRRFEDGDATSIRELATRLTEGVAAWRAPDKVLATIQLWIETAIEKSNDDTYVLLVADDSDAGVVGFISANVQQHYIDGVDAYIGEIVVHEEHGRRGIGRGLIDAVTEWAGEQGCQRLTLQTGAANSGARTFYESLGFNYEDVSFAREISS